MTHEMMLELIASSDHSPRLPVHQGDDNWEDNARVLDDLFADGLVRCDTDKPLIDGSGAYVAYPGLRLTEAGRQKLSQAAIATVEIATRDEVEAVERFLLEVRKVEDAGGLDPEHAAVIDAERTVLEAELRSPRPNRGVIRAALQGLRWAADAVGSAVLGNAAWQLFLRLA